jgi:hypothetical protein
MNAFNICKLLMTNFKMNAFNILLTVSISLNQQLAIQAKSYFWTKFFLQPSETIKTL